MDKDKELRKKAKKKAKEKTGFYVHFLIYILVNAFLYAQWYWITEGEGFPWVITTTVGWGIGIIAHFIGVFIIDPYSEKLQGKEYQKLKEKNK
jgi:hypothetical protein